jgi:glycosyltransferase involved in cell wall biosynthesis
MNEINEKIRENANNENTSQPLFTIATISYNSGKWIEETIESILNSSFTDFELLVSDDRSTDNTWQLIQQYDDKRIVAWQNDFNLGEYPNRNKVLSLSKGKYILYVDGDDVLYKHTLRNLQEYITDFPDCDMIWGVVTFNFGRLPLLLRSEEISNLIYKSDIPLAGIGFSETVFKKDVLSKEGGFSDKYAIGDTYIKKKLAFTSNVLLVPLGFMFWRRSENQASKKAANNFQNIKEAFLIDMDLMQHFSIKDKDDVIKQLKGSLIRRLILSTIMKGKIVSFFKLYYSLLDLRDLPFMFKKYKTNYNQQWI